MTTTRDIVEETTTISKPNMNIPLLFLPETIHSISHDISDLCTAIEYSMKYDTAEEFVAKEIDERILIILNKAEVLKEQPGYTYALGLSIRIFLHLSSDRFPISPANLSVLTSELKAILSEPDIRLCTSYELTAWQLLTGSVATTADSPTGNWFRITLWRVSRAYAFIDWTGILTILSKSFMPHSQLLTNFKTVWTEVTENKAFHI